MIVSVYVYASSQNCVRIRIALCLDLIVEILEFVGNLRRINGIERNAHTSVHRVFDTYGNFYTAGYESVLLIFRRPCTYCNVSQQIVEIMVIVGIKHLVSRTESAFAYRADMHISYCHNTCQDIRNVFVGVGVVEYTLVSLASRTGLVGINSGYDKYFILYFVCYLRKTRNVIAYRFFVICRARSYDKHHSIVLAGNDVASGFVAFVFEFLIFGLEMTDLFYFLFAQYFLYFIKHFFTFYSNYIHYSTKARFSQLF